MSSGIDLVFRNTTRDRRFGESFFRPILVRALKAVNLGGRPVEISVNLVGEKRMRRLNRMYRGKDSATDVLSFSLAEPALTGYTFPRPLGDLFICPAYARRKARAQGMEIGRHMAWLAVHGFLHLAGWDHERSAKSAAGMERLERRILG